MEAVAEVKQEEFLIHTRRDLFRCIINIVEQNVRTRAHPVIDALILATDTEK